METFNCGDNVWYTAHPQVDAVRARIESLVYTMPMSFSLKVGDERVHDVKLKEVKAMEAWEMN